MSCRLIRFRRSCESFCRAEGLFINKFKLLVLSVNQPLIHPRTVITIDMVDFLVYLTIFFIRLYGFSNNLSFIFFNKNIDLIFYFLFNIIF